MPKKTKQAVSGSERSVDLVEVERLLVFMEKHRLEQFEYEREGVRILLKKSSAPLREKLRPTPPARISGVQAAMEAPIAPAPSSSLAAPPVADAGNADDLHVIKSPIVGTFYAAASPDAEPFVAVGNSVEPGQVLCIIEAMKLMNEIETDVKGEVAKIFAKNGSPVEYGEPLFAIRLNGKK